MKLKAQLTIKGSNHMEATEACQTNDIPLPPGFNNHPLCNHGAVAGPIMMPKI